MQGLQAIYDTTAGGRLGAALGTGLQQLAQNKLAQLSQQYGQQQEKAQLTQGLSSLLGPDTANFLSNLGPDERKYAIQNLGSLIQLNREPGQQAPGMEPMMRREPGQQAPGMEPMMRPEDQQQQMTPERIKLIEDIFTSPQEKREREKLDLERKKFNIKETKQYVDNLKNVEKTAKESDLKLERMKNLIEKGNLPNAGLWTFLSKIEELGPLGTAAAGAALGHAFPGVGHAVGGIVGGLTSPLAGAAKSWIKSGNPDIEEFEKLSTDFVKNAKQYFGTRITEKEVQLFMQTIPTLMQTDAGKKRVIENLKSLNELAEIEAKAARSIIRQNNGIPPIDIEDRVKEKIKKKIDKVAKKFTAV